MNAIPEMQVRPQGWGESLGDYRARISKYAPPMIPLLNAVHLQGDPSFYRLEDDPTMPLDGVVIKVSRHIWVRYIDRGEEKFTRMEPQVVRWGLKRTDCNGNVYGYVFFANETNRNHYIELGQRLKQVYYMFGVAAGAIGIGAIIGRKGKNKIQPPPGGRNFGVRKSSTGRREGRGNGQRLKFALMASSTKRRLQALSEG